MIQAIKATKEILEKHQALIVRSNLRPEELVGGYLVRDFRIVGDQTHWYSAEDFHQMWRWVPRTVDSVTMVFEDGQDWGEVEPIPAVPLHPQVVGSTKLKITKMSDQFHEFIMDVPDDAPDSLKFKGIGLPALIRFLKSCDDPPRIEIDHSMAYELVNE